MENITKKEEEESKMEPKNDNPDATNVIAKLLDEIIGNVLPGIDIASKILEDVVENVVATCVIKDMSKKDDFFGNDRFNAPTIHKCTVCSLTYFDRSMFGLHLKSHYAPPSTTKDHVEEEEDKTSTNAGGDQDQPDFSDESDMDSSEKEEQPKSVLNEQDKHIPIEILNRLDGKKCTVCKYFLDYILFPNNLIFNNYQRGSQIRVAIFLRILKFANRKYYYTVGQKI